MRMVQGPGCLETDDRHGAGMSGGGAQVGVTVRPIGIRHGVRRSGLADLARLVRPRGSDASELSADRPQVGAVDQRHDDVGDSPHRVELEDRQDIRMREAGQGLSLASESLARGGWWLPRPVRP